MNKIKLTPENYLQIIEIAKQCSSLTALSKHIYGNHKNTNNLRNFLDTYNFDYSIFNTKAISIFDNEELLKENVKKSHSFTEVIRFFNAHTGGDNLLTLKKYISKYNIDTTHFEKNKKTVAEHEYKTIFTTNSSVSRGIVKRYILKNKLIPYICGNQQCLNKGTWFGETLSLHLEHINGIRNDNRLSNLCFLCPNCHSITSTWGSKNRKNLKQIKKEQEKSIPILNIDKEDLFANIHKFHSEQEICEHYDISINVQTLDILNNFLEENIDNIHIKDYISRRKITNLSFLTNKITKILNENVSYFWEKLKISNNLSELFTNLDLSYTPTNTAILKEFLNNHLDNKESLAFLSKLDYQKEKMKFLGNINLETLYEEVITVGSIEKVAKKYNCSGKGITKKLQRNGYDCSLPNLNKIREERGIKRNIAPTNVVPKNKIEWPDGQAWCGCCTKFKILSLFPPSKITTKGRGKYCTECASKERLKYMRNR